MGPLILGTPTYPALYTTYYHTPYGSSYSSFEIPAGIPVACDHVAANTIWLVSTRVSGTAILEEFNGPCMEKSIHYARGIASS